MQTGHLVLILDALSHVTFCCLGTLLLQFQNHLLKQSIGPWLLKLLASEVTWVVRLLYELGVSSLKPVTPHCDNHSAFHVAKNPVFHERTKHIKLDRHLTCDKVLEGLIQLTYLPTRSQLADIFTKVAPSPHFSTLLSKLGSVSTTSSLPAWREY